MCSNHNYQNSWGKISRIIKFSKTVSRKQLYFRIMYLKPGNFSDPRKIAFVTGHLLLIFQIVDVDFIFLEYKLTVNVSSALLLQKHIKSTSLNNCSHKWVWNYISIPSVHVHLVHGGYFPKYCMQFWWYHAQVGFEQSQQTQFDIFHTKMLQNTSRCHVTASIWILCNILENIPHDI
jgi:hypothetical protein